MKLRLRREERSRRRVQAWVKCRRLSRGRSSRRCGLGLARFVSSVPLPWALWVSSATPRRPHWFLRKRALNLSAAQKQPAQFFSRAPAAAQEGKRQPAQDVDLRHVDVETSAPWPPSRHHQPLWLVTSLLCQICSRSTRDSCAADSRENHASMLRSRVVHTKTFSK